MAEEKKKPQQRMTLRQEKFIALYVDTGNGAESARKAGYSPGTAKETAYEILTYPHIKAAIEAKRAEIAAENMGKREYFIRHLEQLAISATKEADRLRATEMLMKAQGWNAPEKQEITEFKSTFLADLDLEDDSLEVPTIPSQDNPNKINDLH